MTGKIPKYKALAAVVLDLGLAGEWAVDRMMDVRPEVTREEAMEALKYAKKHGAGRQFDRVVKSYLGRVPPF